MDNALNFKEITERLFLLYDVPTQEKLGEHLGVSQDMISKWIRGRAKPTWELMSKVVLETKISWEWLLTGMSSDLHELSMVALRDQPVDFTHYDVLNALLFDAAHSSIIKPVEGMSHTEVFNRALFGSINVKASDGGGFQASEEWSSIAEILNYGENELEFFGSDDFYHKITQLGYSESFRLGYEIVAKVIKQYKNPFPILLEGNVKTSLPISNVARTHNPKRDNEKSPSAKASGEQRMSSKIIEIVFQVQETLSIFGQHLAVGKSATAFPEIQALRGTVQKLQERLANLIPTDETQDHRDHTA